MVKIKVEIYGNQNSIMAGGCSVGECSKGCGSCNSSGDGCSGCGSKESKSKTQLELFNELKSLIQNSDVKEYTELFFFEVSEDSIGGNEEILDLIERDFNLPITVIDGIVRYYGGISNNLIYKDIKELLTQ